MWTFISINWKSLSPKDVVLNWTNGSGEWRFNVFSLFCYYLPLEEDVDLHLNKLESHLPKYALFEWYWPSGSGEDFEILSKHFSYFASISPREKVQPFTWTNWNPFTQGCFVPSLVMISQLSWRRILKVVDNVFSLFYYMYHLPLEKTHPFIRTYLNSLHPRIVCVKFSWNWPIDSISNWERAWPFIRTNLNWCFVPS